MRALLGKFGPFIEKSQDRGVANPDGLRMLLDTYRTKSSEFCFNLRPIRVEPWGILPNVLQFRVPLLAWLKS